MDDSNSREMRARVENERNTKMPKKFVEQEE